MFHKDNSVYYEGDSAKVTLNIQTDKMKTPMQFKVIFSKENGFCHINSLISRQQFEDYCKKNGQSTHSSPAILLNQLYGIALQELRWDNGKLSDLAGKILDMEGKIRAALELNEFSAIDFPIDDERTIRINPCSQNSEIKSMADIEHFLVYDNIVSSSDCLYKIAADILSYDDIEMLRRIEKQELYQTYKEHIECLEDIPFEKWTKSQREDYDHYSDWFKDVHGFRPDIKNHEYPEDFIMVEDWINYLSKKMDLTPEQIDSLRLDMHNLNIEDWIKPMDEKDIPRKILDTFVEQHTIEEPEYDY